jgi:hypothetical protein
MSEEWKRILSQGETMNVDFKGPMSWDGNDRASVAEDIVGMSNIRDGGLIVIGVSESSDGNLSIDGLGAEQAKSFDPTKVIDFVASYFQPSVKLRVERPLVDGKQLVALRVDEFDQTPTICIKDGPVKDSRTGKRHFYEGNVIVRTPAAKTVVIRTSEDMHALIRLAVTKMSNRLLEDMRRLLEGRDDTVRIAAQPHEQDLATWTRAFAERVNAWKQTHPGRGFFSFILLPDIAPEGALDHAAMKKLVQSARVEVKGLELPSCYPDKFTSVMNIPNGVQGRLDLQEYQDVWQLSSSGAFMYARLLIYRQLDQGPPYIPFEEIIWIVMAAILFAQRLYQDLIPEGRIEYRFALASVKDQQLGSFDNYRMAVERILMKQWTAAAEPLLAQGTAAVLDLRSDWRSIVQDVSTKLLTLFNWDRPEAAIATQLDEAEGKRR